jgi:zinc D-Ala-D-Ala carboxypeptidase
MKARRGALLVAVLAAVVVGGTVPAHAYEFSRELRAGDRGPDVRQLEIRIAGWFPRADNTRLRVDERFGFRTVRAVKRFQRRYGLTVDGVAGPQTFEKLDELEDDDGSTLHFDWKEFRQNYNPNCSAKANAYAGTFAGGMTSRFWTKHNVRRLMWRLEAVRAKGGGNPVGINSGFRSVPYNDCIGGARSSQHLYGTGADNRIATVDNRTARDLARRSQVHGIGCYSGLTHNHFDIRIENYFLEPARFWWWPEQDSKGNDLATDDKPCWGEKGSGGVASASTLALVRRGVPGQGSLVPSAAEVRAFEFAGEVGDLQGRD